MLRRGVCIIALVGMVGLVAACDEDEGPDAEQFEATLNGANERPNPVTTTATGRAVFTVREASVDFEIRGSNLTGVIAAHIHGPATSEQATGVLVTLFGQTAPGVNVSGNGVLSSGSFPTSEFTIRQGVTVDSVLTLMRNGMAYVNVHTVANQSGEIRGQISRQ